MKINKSDVYDLLSDILKIDVELLGKVDNDEDLAGYGMTSISAIQLIILLEQKYGFELNDEDLLVERFNTINKLFTLLEDY